MGKYDFFVIFFSFFQIEVNAIIRNHDEWKISKLKSCRVEVLILLYIRLAIESSINLHFFFEEY